MRISEIDLDAVYKCTKCGKSIYRNGLILYRAGGKATCEACIKKEIKEAEEASLRQSQKEFWEAEEDLFSDIEIPDTFDDEDEPVTETPVKKAKENKENRIKTPAEIVKLLDEHVIGQQSAKRSVAVAIFNHLMRTSDNENPEEFPKSNLLICGPSGSGKTELFRTISKYLDIPLAIGDATTLTSAGYKGDDIESLLTLLLVETKGDVAKAEKGIIFIDEFDKICQITDTKQDGYNKTLQQNLLKLIEGKTADVPTSGIEKTKSNTVKMNTGNILFVCGGAFNNIRPEEDEEGFRGEIGFIKTAETPAVSTCKKQERLKAEDFIKYGMIQEIVGRLPVIVELKALSKDDLKEIMIRPKNSVYRKFRNLFAKMNIDLSISDKAMDLIAERAMGLNIGARALNSVLEEYMESLVYEVAGHNESGKLTITKRMVEKHFAELDRQGNRLSA